MRSVSRRTAAGLAVVAGSRRWGTSICSVLAVAMISLAGLVTAAAPAAAGQAGPSTPPAEMVGPSSPAPAMVRPSAVTAAAQACSQVLVAPSSWLGGAGIAVHSNGAATGTGNSCAGLSTSNPSAQNGYGWQCVELAARLYAVKGWGRVYADGGAAAGTYRYGAEYIPEGSPNLQFRPNGSGYLPVPGDLIIEAYSSGWGHVSVVDQTDGSSVHAVEQNATPTGRHDYTLTGSTLSGAYGGIIRGYMHAPANTATGSPSGLSSHDFTGDGKADILGVTPSGDMYLYRGNGAGGFAAGGTKIGASWNMFAQVFSPGDYSGDGKADVIGVTPSGDMYLYRGNGAGGFSSAAKIGAGWNMFAKVFAPGDFTGDGRSDIVGITPSGDMYLYRGNGAGGFAAGGAKIGASWNMYAKVFSPPGDFTGDEKADIMGITPGGDQYLYRGNGAGGFTSAAKIGADWNMFAQVF